MSKSQWSSFRNRKLKDQTAYNLNVPKIPKDLTSTVFSNSDLLYLAELYYLHGNDPDSFKDTVRKLENQSSLSEMRQIDGFESLISFSRSCLK
jgi:hypothetical protein